MPDDPPKNDQPTQGEDSTSGGAGGSGGDTSIEGAKSQDVMREASPDMSPGAEDAGTKELKAEVKNNESSVNNPAPVVQSDVEKRREADQQLTQMHKQKEQEKGMSK